MVKQFLYYFQDLQWKEFLVEMEKPNRDFINIFLSMVPTAILHSKKKLQKYSSQVEAL